KEKQIIRKTYRDSVSGGRGGTWNIASIFIVRSQMLLREGGELGFLIPNSILRVGQFTKTRNFILSKMMLREIIDEASPFDGVTLEMVSIFCSAKQFDGEYEVSVTTTRKDIPHGSVIPSRFLTRTKIIPLYYDTLFVDILNKGKQNMLRATRGRDLHRDHVRKGKDKQFTVSYATRGSSVKRYKFDSKYLTYSDDSFRADKGMMDSFENEFLVATKNYPFPRCVMKPRGVLHGGGIVKIEIADENIDPEVIGLILNSRLIRYLCIRYLTNYSKLTTCLNTGIMEDLPIVYPDSPNSFKLLFRTLQILHKEEKSKTKSVCQYIDRVADALVYSLYLYENQQLLSNIEKALGTLKSKKPIDVFDVLSKPKIKQTVEAVYLSPLVQKIENSPRMK
ncbi:MAG: Eco57I restriction-modification methylase domain-containing protein, partial [Candidatus Thorarchaeota archaeon]